MNDNGPTEQWLLISYHVPTNPSALRVATWRALKQLGAVVLGDGLYALEASGEHRAALTQLSGRITQGGGTSICFEGSGLTDDDRSALRTRSKAAREDEYRQVMKSARKFLDHVAREEDSEDFRFAEVESLEEELEKVHRQLERVIRRDSAGLGLRDEAQRSLAAARDRLDKYTERASLAEGARE
jgi:exonuclease VII small subunit